MSEFSRRYITDNIEIYWPSEWRFAADNVKQGSSSDGICVEKLEQNLEMFNSQNIQNLTDEAISLYQNLLDRHNIAPEMARMVLPQSLMTSWRWSGSLGAFCKMCNLRLDPHAQKEAQIVAQEIKNTLEYLYPVSSKLLIRR